MIKIFKRMGKLTMILSFVLMGTVLFVSNCTSFDFEMNQEKVDAHFASRGITARSETYHHEGREMHYVSTGDQSKPMVLFVHGSPGSWDAFINFMSNGRLLEYAHVVSVDRPGFGKSGRDIAERSIKRQAADIKPILDANTSSQGAILVGHSLGGPVIAQMAMDYPDQVAGLILVAPSIDPELEKTKWYQIPADWMLFSWMVPKVLVTTNREILPLKAELERMMPQWKDIRVPVTVIQGEKDKLVPAANADFARKALVNAPLTMVRIENMNHFVPWTHPALIEKAILDHLNAEKEAPLGKEQP